MVGLYLALCSGQSARGEMGRLVRAISTPSPCHRGIRLPSRHNNDQVCGSSDSGL